MEIAACLFLVFLCIGTMSSFVHIGILEKAVGKALLYSGGCLLLTVLLVAVILGKI